MKQTYIPILISILLTISIVPIHTNAQTTSTTIICTNSILADFTSNIISKNVTIDYIMPAGACPSHFDTKPSDIALIASADIIISLGIEPWVESLINSSENTDVHQIICTGLGEWNIPSGATLFVQKISTELKQILPDYTTTITMNTQNYLNEINSTAQTLQTMIETNGHINKTIICMKWQQEFLEWLGLHILYSYPPPESLSTQDELEIINLATQHQVYAVIDNLQSGTEFGAHIAAESGATHVIFNNFPKAVPNTETYLEMITYNTEQLINGINTYEYKQGDLASLEEELTTIQLQRNTLLVLALIFILSTILLFIMYKRK